MRTRIPGVWAVLLVCLAGGPVMGAETGLPPGFDAYVQQVMREWQVPGLALAIVRDGRVVLAKGYGVRRVGREDPVDEQTLFQIGSSSKAFTATVAAILVDEGRLAWDDPVVKHLPWFQMSDPWVTRHLTVRDLLCHRAGLPTYGGDGLLLFGYDAGEIARRIRLLEPASSFRARWAYQNVMYTVAGQVAASAAGRPWDELVAERIFRPLGMSSSRTRVAGLATAPNVAAPHLVRDGQPTPIAWRDIYELGPAGSIVSNLAEMTRWLQFQLQDGAFEGTQVVSAKSLAETHAPQMLMPNEGKILAYGLGWMIAERHGLKLVTHSGNIDGMSASVAMLPERRAGIVVLTNLHLTPAPDILTGRVLDALQGIPPDDWSTQFKKRAQAAEAKDADRERELNGRRVRGAGPTLPLSRYTGTYENPLYGRVQLAEEGDRLTMATGPNGVRFTLVHWHYDVFRFQWAEPVPIGFWMPELDFATFAIDESGQAQHIVTGLGTFTRSPLPRP